MNGTVWPTVCVFLTCHSFKVKVISRESLRLEKMPTMIISNHQCSITMPTKAGPQAPCLQYTLPGCAPPVISQAAAAWYLCLTSHCPSLKALSPKSVSLVFTKWLRPANLFPQRIKLLQNRLCWILSAVPASEDSSTLWMQVLRQPKGRQQNQLQWHSPQEETAQLYTAAELPLLFGLQGETAALLKHSLLCASTAQRRRGCAMAGFEGCY